MDWKTFILSPFNDVHSPIGDNDKVVVYAPDYLKNLTVILNEMQNSEEGIM